MDPLSSDPHSYSQKMKTRRILHDLLVVVHLTCPNPTPIPPRPHPLRVYDNRDRTSESVLSPSPPSFLTYVPRCIGYHRPTWYSLSKSERLMYLSVYANRDRSSESVLSSSPPSSFTHTHRCIGYHNPTWYLMTTEITVLNPYSPRSPPPHSRMYTGVSVITDQPDIVCLSPRD